MENILSYYYHIIISNQDINNENYFTYNNHLFCFTKYLRNANEIEKLYLLNNFMINNNHKVNKIVSNIENKILTKYNDYNYVLIEIIYKEIDDLKFYFINIGKVRELDILRRDNWGFLWSKKIDYVEYQIEHLLHKYPFLYNSVNYYIGLGENAIMYYNMLNINANLYVTHRRVKEFDNSIYNPLELVIDYKVRDICELIKSNFFNKQLSIEEIIDYIKGFNLMNEDYVLLYTRMLFPTYYFDVYDKIINDSLNEKEILRITNKVNEYERLLYEIYLLIKEKTNIIGIDWINSKFN